MSETTTIEWTDATFNPWWGCAKVSPACDHCYAERDAKRYQPGRVLWGVNAERRVFGEKHWNEPRRWNARALREGRRIRVFCASMADVFDNHAPEGEREKLWQLIRETPALDWLLLTKRIGNAYTGMLPLDFHAGTYPNVWLGITVINQEEANRDIPKLIGLNARVRFLSIEPMLGAIELDDWLMVRKHWKSADSLPSVPWHPPYPKHWYEAQKLVAAGWSPPLHWVIAGAESGPHARPSHSDWFRSLRDQCTAARVPFLFKQWGEWMPVGKEPNEAQRLTLAHARPTARCYSWPDGETMVWAGKKAAGRLLDGVTHDGVPS